MGFIQSKWGKIRTRITPNTDIFHAVFAIANSITVFKLQIDSF